jgi:flagellar motor switch protein FliN/FliY
MNQLHPSIASLLGSFAAELQAELSPGSVKGKPAESSDGASRRVPADLAWWSWSLSIDSASRIVAGAPLEAWQRICGLEEALPEELKDACLVRLTPALERTARTRFGSEVSCSAIENTEAPPEDWKSTPFTITDESGSKHLVYFGVNPDLELALGASEVQAGTTGPPEKATSSADILMHVEMPVSISLGRTKMRMKELLNLTNGSVVELDQELADEVEIRVSNCVLAYGEVVAVDGNYAVRVLRMAPSRNGADLRGELPERVA